MATLRQTELAQQRFLAAFAERGIVSYAAKAAGVNRGTVYGWLEHDEPFSFAYKEAEQAAVESAEAELYRRAVEGVERPVFQAGRQVGSIREYSDALLMFLLRSRKPETYRERIDVQHHGMTAKAYVGVDLERMLRPPDGD